MKTFSFSLAWDNPIVRFGGGRGYTRFYSRSGQGSLGLTSPPEYLEPVASRVLPWRPMLSYRRICEYSPLLFPPLLTWGRWQSSITQWQQEVQNDQSLPSYYRSDRPPSPP
jgi:hypothetical protein